MKLILVVSFCILSSIAFSKEEFPSEKLNALKNSYDAKVKVIFDKKCNNCHGGSLPKNYMPDEERTKYFSKIIQKSKRHFDTSKGFPFISKHTMKEIVHETEKLLVKGKMPPPKVVERYPEFALTDEEKRIILEWVKQ